MHISAQRSFHNIIKNFDVRSAQLKKDSDRALLLDHVQQLFGDDDENAADGEEVPNRNSNLSTNTTRGIDRFNQIVRDRVPQQLPVSGIRRWVLLSYIPCLLMSISYEGSDGRNHGGWLVTLDKLSYRGSVWQEGNFDKGAWFGFRFLVYKAWLLFLFYPFRIFVHSLVIRLVIWLEGKLNWPWWSLFPGYILIDYLFPVREWLSSMLHQFVVVILVNEFFYVEFPVDSGQLKYVDPTIGTSPLNNLPILIDHWLDPCEGTPIPGRSVAGITSQRKDHRFLV